MKRKAVSILVAGLIAVSLTGCGTQAKATNADVPVQEETVVVAQDVNMEAETVAKTADDEMVGDDSFVFYTKYIGKFVDEPLDTFEFETIDEKATIEDDVLIERGDQIVGYIKGGATVRLIEHGIDSFVYRVENTSGVGYEYIYVTEDAFLTVDDMKEFVVEHLNVEKSTITDTPDADMEYIEFTIERSYRSGVEDYIIECIKDIRDTYNTFCVECTKNEQKLIDVKVYYK